MSAIQTGIELNDQFTSVIYGIINSVNLAVSSIYDMQQGMNADIDTSSMEGARDEINQATAALNEMNAAMQNQTAAVEVNTQPQISPTPAEIPVTWNTDSLDAFTGSGIDRFRQEVQSTNDMLTQLSSTQDAIAKQAYNTNIFPPEAFQELNSLAVRVDRVRDRIQQIENNPVNIGTDTANAQMEQLRVQLSQSIQVQNDLNAAMQRMDVSAANDAYMRLSRTVSGTERYIRDNVDAQGRFNQEIQGGTQQANDLVNTIKGAVAAYVSIQSVGKGLNISDELTQITARLSMMNDGVHNTDELVNMIYAAAQNARGSFSEMASVVAKFGNNAKDAFGNTDEVVAFATLVQKQMTIAGASTTEASNAMLQLSQALGSGVLRGDELNSIFEQAPNLIQNIADYLGVPIGEIRDMASEGELSADIVKAAIFAASDEINRKFEDMPMTWGQVWQSMQNTATVAFRPVLQRINEVANSEGFQEFVNGTTEAMATLANIILNIFDLIGAIGGFISDNWSIISPIVYGIVAAMSAYLVVAAIVAVINGVIAASNAVKAASETLATGRTLAYTASQHGLNAALAACPITWIILLIIALIAIIFAVCSAIAKFTGVAESGFGVICGVVNVAIQYFKNLGLTVANMALGIWEAIGACVDNIQTAFHNGICNIQSWWYDLLSTVLTVVSGICEALNKLPFIEFDYSGITAAADEYAAKSAEAKGNKEEYTNVADAFNEGYSTFDAFQEGWMSDAFQKGAEWGDGISEKISNFSLSDLLGKTEIPPDDYTEIYEGMGESLESISDDTGNISDAMDIAEETLKYMRDLAEQETVNRYTVAEINIDQSGMQNTVKNGDDLDGFMSNLTDAVNDAIDSITEGVHP